MLLILGRLRTHGHVLCCTRRLLFVHQTSFRRSFARSVTISWPAASDEIDVFGTWAAASEVAEGRSSALENLLPSDASRPILVGQGQDRGDFHRRQLKESAGVHAQASDSLHIPDKVDQHVIEQGHQRIQEALNIDHDNIFLDEVSEVATDHQVIASLPTTNFIEILRRAEPSDDFLPFRSYYANRISKNYPELKPEVRRASLNIENRKKFMWSLWKGRTQRSEPLSTEEYAQLLKFARGIFDGCSATLIVREMMDRGVKLDLSCYNYYLETLCWSDAWYPNERQMLRVIPYTLRRREADRTPLILGNIRIHRHTV